MDTSDAAFVLAVRHLEAHGREVDVVEVVEAVSRVAAARRHILQIAQPSCPQNTTPHCLPIDAEVGLAQGSHALVDVPQARDGGARVVGVYRVFIDAHGTRV